MVTWTTAPTLLIVLLFRFAWLPPRTVTVTPKLWFLLLSRPLVGICMLSNDMAPAVEVWTFTPLLRGLRVMLL